MRATIRILPVGIVACACIFPNELYSCGYLSGSLLGLGAEGVMVLCVHAEGSHVIEAFLRGTVDIHKKKRLLKLLKGHFLKV